ncbi:M24 family metallopeptidase [Paraburkholderia sp. 35.1]|uniref:M24 family metallopeptidase n=1 Tax=Paraburkholderia sp. 35.1 TaxID=2991058 RepID=UPI003D206E1B
MRARMRTQRGGRFIFRLRGQIPLESLGEEKRAHQAQQPRRRIMTDIGARYRGYVADDGRGFTYGPANPSEARGPGTGHGTGMDPEEEAPWIGPGNRTVLQENMVFTMKATITVPNVGGLRTERIVRLTSGGVETLDQFRPPDRTAQGD